jgi:hypothetical protein
MVEWPSQVTRNPDDGGDAKRAGSTGAVLGRAFGFALGSARNRVTIAAHVSFTIGCGFSK